MEADFASEKVHPGDLKSAVEKYLNRLLDPVRKYFETPELKKLVAKAYPPPAKAKAAPSGGKKGGGGGQPETDELIPSRLNMKEGNSTCFEQAKLLYSYINVCPYVCPSAKLMCIQTDIKTCTTLILKNVISKSLQKLCS